jgi:hypothetical protein
VKDFLDALKESERGFVGRLANARERWRGDGFRDPVCTAGRGIQLNLLLADEIGLYTGGGGEADWTTGISGSQASEMSQKLRRLTGAHLLECEDLARALLSRV